MRDGVSSSFETPKFKELLARYEEMVRQHTSVYFESDELTLIAEYYAGKKMIAELQNVLQYALNLYPDNIDIQAYICHTLIAEGKLAEAENLLRSLPDQEDQEVLFLWATLCIERGELQKANEIFLKIEQEDDDVLIQLDIADIYMDYNKGKEALIWLEKANKKAPDNPEVWDSLSAYHYTYGNMNTAIEYFNKLLDENPYETRHWINLTHCFLRQEKTQKALEAIDFALAINEQNPIALELKGLCYMQQGDAAQTCKYFLQIEETSPNRQRIRQMMSECYFAMQDYEKAIEYIDKVLSENNIADFERAILFQKRALSHIFLDKIEQCKQDIENGLSYDKQYAPLYLTLGEYYIRVGKYTEAQTEIAYAEALASDKEEIIESISQVYFRNELLDEALTCYEYMEKSYPYLVKNYYFVMGYCYYIKGEREKAFRTLVKAIVSSPDTLNNIREVIGQEGEENLYFHMALDIKHLIDKGSLNPLDYLDE